MKTVLANITLFSIRSAIFFCVVNLYVMWSSFLTLPTIPVSTLF